MREEKSAGAVVFKKNEGEIHLLLIRDQNENWTFPKGLIEAGEDEKDTAIREVGEETGITRLEFFSNLTPIQYWYRWEGDLIRKTVYYFLFEAKGGEKTKPQKEEGISEVDWFGPQRSWEIVGYRKTNKKILEEVLNKLKIKIKT